MSKPFRARKTILNACTRKTGEQDYLLKRIRIAVKLSTVRIHEMLLKILEKLQKYEYIFFPLTKTVSFKNLTAQILTFCSFWLNLDFDNLFALIWIQISKTVDNYPRTRFNVWQ